MTASLATQTTTLYDLIATIQRVADEHPELSPEAREQTEVATIVAMIQKGMVYAGPYKLCVADS
ncbi:MAG: hypothetical protein Greene041614_579 [Parcubacteria group bacterium Greene0416_14]|nr:MAG: hypothetical protein Greene041614_579 [Parcubacteria group bacterium Greene0416_14]TSD00595.1 MAG: hypothetical protein Greene101415_816 [Parcubacteria group bacterium Greene1014_15]TSD08285.1 MAG: hypothetical protein Greene07144_267 [Parcubacteria group bacterium Greene0714_4]